MRRVLALLAVGPFLCAAPAPGAVQPAQESHQLDLVTRNSVEIAAPAHRIWPRLFELTAWKKSVARNPHVSGPRHAVGEISAVYLAGGGDKPAYHLRIVELAEGRRVVWRLFKPDDPKFVGYVSAELFQVGRRTRMTWDVYSALEAPSPPGANAEALIRQYVAATKAKLDADNAALKILVEHSR